MKLVTYKGPARALNVAGQRLMRDGAVEVSNDVAEKIAEAAEAGDYDVEITDASKSAKSDGDDEG